MGFIKFLVLTLVMTSLPTGLSPTVRSAPSLGDIPDDAPAADVRPAQRPPSVAAPAVAQHADCGVHRHQADVVRVIDGDTIVADVDLGFSVWRHGEHLRLYGVDTPEVRGPSRPSGLVAKRAVEDLVDGKRVVLCTHPSGTGKFGRPLVTIFVGERTLQSILLERGLARPTDDDGRPIAPQNTPPPIVDDNAVGALIARADPLVPRPNPIR